MIVSPDNWAMLWEIIEQEMQDSGEKNIIVICSMQEVETVCAVKMMQVGLGTQGLSFSVYPVQNHSDLKRTLTQLLTDSQEMRTVVLLNCGASEYAPSLAPPSAANVRYVVVDSHRPVALAYNDEFDNDAVLLLADDDPLAVRDIPTPSDLDAVTPEELEQLEAEADAEREAEEEEEAAGGLDSPAKRQRLGEGSAGVRARHECRDRLRMVKERKTLVENYLDLGSSYGKPSPLVLLPLAELLLSKADNSLLWPAAVGLTDQWVHQRVSHQHHAAWYAQLADAVKAADANFAAQQQQQQRAGRGGGGGSEQQRGGDSGSSRQPISQAKLVAAKDYRLMLFRHWTLFDAFCFSPYVAPRLQTWRPGGKEAVSLLFANMGVSLEQAKTEYNSMQSRSQRLFAAQLERALLKTSLSYRELAADGFQLHHSRKVTAASDMVHACTALLSEHSVSDVTDQGGDAAALGFWAALRALDCQTPTGWTALLKGVEDAKMLQQAIIMDGGNMVTDQKLKVNPTARMQELNLAALAPTNAAEFRHPLTLLRLAHFVRDATKIARQGGGLRASTYPIMVIGPEDAAGWCIVIGLRASVLADNAQYNIFGRTFTSVLTSQDSEVQWDASREGFDASVVYVHRDSLVTFSADVRAALIANAAAAATATATKQSQQQQQQEQQQQRHGGGGADIDAADDRRRRRRSGGGDDDAEAAGSGAASGDAGGPFSDVDSLPGTEGLQDASEEELDMVAASDDEQGGTGEEEEEELDEMLHPGGEGDAGGSQR